MTVKDPEQCTTMAEVREGVDDIDSKIMALVAQRFSYMDAAARIKTERSAVRDEARKAKVLEHVAERAQAAGLDPQVMVRMYDDLIEASISHELKSFDRNAGK
jgi:isochorismate pyruvate lyase